MVHEEFVGRQRAHEALEAYESGSPTAAEFATATVDRTRDGDGDRARMARSYGVMASFGAGYSPSSLLLQRQKTLPKVYRARRIDLP